MEQIITKEDRYFDRQNKIEDAQAREDAATEAMVRRVKAKSKGVKFTRSILG